MVSLDVTETLPSTLLRNTQDLMNQLSVSIPTLFTALKAEGHTFGHNVLTHEDPQ